MSESHLTYRLCVLCQEEFLSIGKQCCHRCCVITTLEGVTFVNNIAPA